MSTLAYEIVDVFTDRPFAGNQLAVVFGADGLAGDQLLALAREFNLSETVFVLPPTAPEATWR
ncbi:MAG TPA: PhzF family phenazine biosynthesis protein, partial [Micromonospora sp.]